MSNLTEYQRGWKDCRGYRGEEQDQSPHYHQGFYDCLREYHDSCENRKGWSEVQEIPLKIKDPTDDELYLNE